MFLEVYEHVKAKDWSAEGNRYKSSNTAQALLFTHHLDEPARRGDDYLGTLVLERFAHFPLSPAAVHRHRADIVHLFEE